MSKGRTATSHGGHPSGRAACLGPTPESMADDPRRSAGVPFVASLQVELVNGSGAGGVSGTVMEMDAVLDLRAGELVEVRSRQEILRTLDSRGTLDSLPFMPEMLDFCGRRFRVYKRADKVCDTIDWGALRRMERAVHLEGVRCNGGAHAGCQAGCLIHWKEAWLKRVVDSPDDSTVGVCDRADDSHHTDASRCSEGTLVGATRKKWEEEEEIFSCQATELIRATTSSIPWWSVGQYVRDVRSGNADVGTVIRGLVVGFFNKFQKANAKILPRLTLVHGGRTYPFVLGKPTSSFLSSDLGLRPGELVEVKSREEIFETLDESDRTRGLRFDGEMLQYCGRRGRVLRRIQKIIDEKTGRMLSIDSDCIVIDGFICTGDYHRSCPRAVYPYWRESWLKRVEEDSSDGGRRPAAC